ncbi:MAG: hypothetical protein GX660_29165, partial [Clostridiaceae bacterium]|nr:hypothetical protein [Clostridiaceae bacterium]
MDENTSILFAEKAFDLCRKAYRAKDIPLARIYALNAITHHSNTKYLEAYLSIVKKIPASDRRVAIEEALNIYSMAMYQCDPEEIGKIQELIAQLEEIQDESFARDVSWENNPENTPSSNRELIEQYSWNALRKNGMLEKLDCVREKSILFQQLIDSGNLNSTRRQQCEKEFQESITLLDYLTKIEIFENTLAEIKKELDSKTCNIYYTAARLQNGASLLSQLWLLDVSNIITDSKSRLNALALKLEDFERKYNKFRSEPLFRELKSKLQNAISKKTEPGAKLTPFLVYWQKIAQEVSPKLCELSDSDAVMELQKLLNQLNSLAESI